MKPTESLPLKEWYQLAEEMAATAKKMIEIGKEIESLPEDAPDNMIRDFSNYMHNEIHSDGDSIKNTLYLFQIDLDEYAASMIDRLEGKQ